VHRRNRWTYCTGTMIPFCASAGDGYSQSSRRLSSRNLTGLFFQKKNGDKNIRGPRLARPRCITVSVQHAKCSLSVSILTCSCALRIKSTSFVVSHQRARPIFFHLHATVQSLDARRRNRWTYMHNDSILRVGGSEAIAQPGFK